MRGYPEPTRYYSEPLGLIVPLTSFEAIEGGRVEVALWRRDAVSVASGSVRVLMTSYTPELEQRLVTTFSTRQPRRRADAPLRWGDVDPHGRRPRTRTSHWRLDSGMRERVLVLAPFCDDLGTFMFEAAFAGRGTVGRDSRFAREHRASTSAPRHVPMAVFKANRAEPSIPRHVLAPC